ncbi:tigger transposable element-derived protein 4-like [Pseudomyrmex gracilis]|uniref:tigger transposable element-derived protein 4-like n=1 Tax=Pseudomyrmex gracilis TaxID=219809 RepID=UPI000995868F|nr:tigger transposable element-derived protein 4-like [Pseudomyrmex gracilis]
MKAIKDALLKWTCERHAMNQPLDKGLLRDKALKLTNEYRVTGFKCSERWLTSFLKKCGFSLDSKGSIGPTFNDYRLWIDTMRFIIMQYKYENLFHLDELTMYLDVSPSRISSIQQDKSNLKKATILMCCNASGTEKLPLLICGSYPTVITENDHVYGHSEDALISDNLLKEWLTRLNDRMSSSSRKILLMLHRNRTSAFRNLKLSNVKHIFFPDNFPSLATPLKRDVFHFVKMTYRSKYLEEIGKHERQWNVGNVVSSLVEAWREVPRDLIVASFRRTSFRTDDDCFLEIHCDSRNNVRNEVSFRKFVSFDDDLSANNTSARSSGKSTEKNHGYNLRSKNVVTLIDDSKEEDLEEENLINNHSRARGSDRTKKKLVDREVKNSRKTSNDKAQLSEDRYKETNISKSSDKSTSKNNEDVATISTSVGLPRITDVRTIANATRSSEKSHSTQDAANTALIAAVTIADCDLKLDETAKVDEKRKNNCTSNNERSIESSPKITGSSSSDVVSQQVFDNTKELIAGMISRAVERNATESTNSNGNDDYSSQKSLKRQRSSRFTDVEESKNDTDDNEPERKKSRSDSDWTKQYETTFVFGLSDLTRTIPTVSADVLSDNDAQLAKPWKVCKTERGIFTITPKKD